MKKETKEFLKELEDVIDKSAQNLEQGPALKVVDVTEEIRLHLDEDGLKVLDLPAVEQLMKVENDKVKHVVRYFGVTTYDQEVGAKKLAGIVNDVAKFKPVGILAKPCRVELNFEPELSIDAIANVIYLAFEPNEAVLLERHEWAMREGETPRQYMETPDDLGLDE